ncbi:MAG: DUF3347 domain-containing protein [Bdellovibrionales bacterium]|jgi:hypothetical protein|nr:DUF3347 domain-containing protein [Bdellovibrionales bacterium]
MKKILIKSLLVFCFIITVSNANEKRKELKPATKKNVIAVLSVNESLHSAFFTYSGKLVEKEARNLIEKINDIKNEEISKLLQFSKSKLSEIKEANERDKNDQSYHSVSMALIHIVNKYDLGSKYNAYSCPMVKKKWIQNSEKMSKVHNPYAPGMPHCGLQDSKY